LLWVIGVVPCDFMSSITPFFPHCQGSFHPFLYPSTICRTHPSTISRSYRAGRIRRIFFLSQFPASLRGVGSPALFDRPRCASFRKERARGNWILELRAQKIISHPRREKPLPAQFILLKSPRHIGGMI